MGAASVSAVLFARDLANVAAFYSTALEMKVIASDQHHWRLDCDGFELVIHQIPQPVTDSIVIERPPHRRVASAIRLDYSIHDIAASRQRARALGGDIDDAPPEWAERNADFYFGHDPEGNQFGVSRRS